MLLQRNIRALSAAKRALVELLTKRAHLVAAQSHPVHDGDARSTLIVGLDPKTAQRLKRVTPKLDVQPNAKVCSGCHHWVIQLPHSLDMSWRSPTPCNPHAPQAPRRWPISGWVSPASNAVESQTGVSEPTLGRLPLPTPANPSAVVKCTASRGRPRPGARRPPGRRRIRGINTVSELNRD